MPFRCNMNNYFVNSAACWRRYHSTDKYCHDAEWYSYRPNNTDPETFMTNNVGKFKHEVFALSLRKSPYDDLNTKAIYLYVSGFRVLKCYFQEKNILRVECRNDEIAEHFRSSREKLATNGRWPLLKKDFFNNFTQLQYVPAGYYHWGYFDFLIKKRKGDLK